MLLSKAVERFYQKQLQYIGVKCPGCGINMTRIEVEEFGRCWLCVREAREDVDQARNRNAH